MKNLEKIFLVIAFLAILLLIITVQHESDRREEFYTQVDSTIIKADSALIKAQQNVELTDSLTQLLKMENKEIMDDVKYNKELNGIR